MKFTIAELKQIIKEEVDSVMMEDAPAPPPSWEDEVNTYVISIMAELGIHTGRPSLFLGGFFARHRLQEMMDELGLSEEELKQMDG